MPPAARRSLSSAAASTTVSGRKNGASTSSSGPDPSDGMPTCAHGGEPRPWATSHYLTYDTPLPWTLKPGARQQQQLRQHVAALGLQQQQQLRPKLRGQHAAVASQRRLLRLQPARARLARGRGARGGSQA